MPLVFHFVYFNLCECVCFWPECIYSFCTRQRSKFCDVSADSEQAGNLGVGLSPESLSFSFTGEHVCSCAHTQTHTHTNKHTVIITEKPASVQAGSVPSFLCPSNILSFCVLSFGVGYFFALFFPVCSYTQTRMHRNHRNT